MAQRWTLQLTSVLANIPTAISRDPEPELPTGVTPTLLTNGNCEIIHLCHLQLLGFGVICYQQ